MITTIVIAILATLVVCAGVEIPYRRWIASSQAEFIQLLNERIAIMETLVKTYKEKESLLEEKCVAAETLIKIYQGNT